MAAKKKVVKNPVCYTASNEFDMVLSNTPEEAVQEAVDNGDLDAEYGETEVTVWEIRRVGVGTTPKASATFVKD